MLSVVLSPRTISKRRTMRAGPALRPLNAAITKPNEQKHENTQIGDDSVDGKMHAHRKQRALVVRTCRFGRVLLPIERVMLTVGQSAKADKIHFGLAAVDMKSDPAAIRAAGGVHAVVGVE